MQVTLLGTGTPILDPARQQSAVLIQVGDQKLLFDAGRGVTTQLTRAGIQPQDINAVFITHHHYDHICDLGEWLLTAWHNGRVDLIGIYGPQGTRAIVNALFEHVYARDIAFTLCTDANTIDIRNLVHTVDVAPGLVYETGECKVLTQYVEHGNMLGLSREDWPCLGYRIEAEGKSVVISGDTVACAGLDWLAWNTDCLIQCCYLAEAELTNVENARLAQHIIASARQAGEIAMRNQVHRLVLTHIRPKPEAMMHALVEDVRVIYGGPVIVGEDLMVIRI